MLLSTEVLTMRKGVSFTLVIIVSALIMIVAAATLIISSQGILGQIGSFLRAGSPSEADEARSYCLERKMQACQSLEDGSQEWAENLVFEGRSCRDWAEQENIFGSDGVESIPPC